jgi:hypothetical protein
MSSCWLQQYSKIVYQTSNGEDTWQSESPGESTGTSPEHLANRRGVQNPDTFAKLLKPLPIQ